VRKIVWSLVVLTAWGCRSQTQNESAGSPSRFPCLSPDSGTLAYGDILIDSAETGDASGVQFTFQMHDTLQGFVRDATGEIPPALPLKDLKSFAMGDSISFWFGDDLNKSIHRYQFRCDQLLGTAQPFVTPQSPGSTYVDTMRRSVPIKKP
jgi:hypothetical protein